MSALSGYISSANPSSGLVAKSEFKQEVDIAELKKMAHKMGLSPDIYDMLESFEECKYTLESKSMELNALQALAMESDDENITDLREQLFVVTKLLYSDIIEDIMKEPGYQINAKDSSYLDDDFKSDMSKGNMFQQMRIYMNKRKRYKEQLTKIKKRLKENMDLL